jgi:hypothetical protein
MGGNTIEWPIPKACAPDGVPVPRMGCMRSLGTGALGVPVGHQGSRVQDNEKGLPKQATPCSAFGDLVSLSLSSFLANRFNNRLQLQWHFYLVFSLYVSPWYVPVRCTRITPIITVTIPTI